jgi:hypothetical protein
MAIKKFDTMQKLDSNYPTYKKGSNMTKNVLTGVNGVTILFACAVWFPSACSQPQGVTQAADGQVEHNGAFCTRLKELIAMAPSDFKQIKTNRLASRRIHPWRTDVRIDDGDCVIYGWGSGFSTYYCAWTQKSEPSTLSRYQSYKSTIKSCLGNAWELDKEEQTRTGQKTSFKQPNSPHTVSIGYMQDKSLVKKHWKINMFVGDSMDSLYQSISP